MNQDAMESDLSRAEMLDFLRRNFIMSIAFSKDDKPSSSVVMYVVDDELNFYFVTHGDSYKAQILRANPKISLSVWEHREMMIQADGNVVEVTDREQKKDLLDKLITASQQDPTFWPPILKLPGESFSFFKITPTWLRRLDLRKLVSAPDAHAFTQYVS